MPEIIYDDDQYLDKPPFNPPPFIPPIIQENLAGWGPCEMPEQFKDMPYQPFSKGDRLGKVCLCFLYTRNVRLYLYLYLLMTHFAHNRYPIGPGWHSRTKSIPVSIHSYTWPLSRIEYYKF